MKRRIAAIALLCIMLFIIPFHVFATESTLPSVVDHAGLLTSEEVHSLENTARQIQSAYGLDVVIVTIWDLEDKTAQEYADDYYDQHGYGYGTDASGILLLLAMETREWYMSTCGEAIYIFTDYGLDQMGEAIVPDLAEGNYHKAFMRWMDEIPRYCEAYGNREPIDGYVPQDAYVPEGEEDIVYPDFERDTASRDTLLSAVAGLIAAAVTVLIMRSSMNTAKLQSGAADYVKKGSCELIFRRDMYLYSKVSKTAKPQNNGGGSSVHRSSGGSSHGGRGGKF